MQPKSRHLLTVSIVLIIAAAIIVVLQKPNLSDHAQIANQIDAMVTAAQNKDVGGVMAGVSDSYSDPVIGTSEQLAFVLRHRVFSSEYPVQLTAATSTITVTGNTATSVTNIHLQSSGRPIYDGNLALTWRKEPVRRFLIIPDTAWRVTSAQYPNENGFDE